MATTTRTAAQPVTSNVRPAPLSDRTIATLLRLSALAQSAGESAHEVMAQVLAADTAR